MAEYFTFLQKHPDEIRKRFPDQLEQECLSDLLGSLQPGLLETAMLYLEEGAKTSLPVELLANTLGRALSQFIDGQKEEPEEEDQQGEQG